MKILTLIIGIYLHGVFSNHVTMAIGGSILFLSAMLLIYIVTQTLFVLPKIKYEKDIVEFPIAEDDVESTPRFLENWWLWIGISFVLIVIAYSIPLADMIHHTPSGSKGFKTW